jgi:hypothetical protein
MKTLGRASLRHTWQTLVLAASLPLTSVAAPATSLDGVWKLSHPQTLLLPADGREIPFTDEGRKIYEANKAMAAKGDYSFDTSMTRCSSPGFPRLMLTPDRFRIFQRPTIVAIQFEWNRLLRQIDMPGSFTGLKHSLLAPNDSIGTMNGVAHGHWQGSTLVAESSQFLDGKLLDNLLVGSDQLKLTERIRLRDKDTLEDRITIADANMFTRPWDTVISYQRQPDQPFPEDVCLNRRDAGQSPLPR